MMYLSKTADLWWKDAVVYCLDVETFSDSNGDGHGDFRGLVQRIDYLAELGVNCLWLMPFYPTPERDDGYDITDYFGVDPRLGSLGDVVELVRTANDRGIRVIADLVVNHTSNQHPWFQSARESRESPYRDWYVWRDEPPPDADKGVVFPDKEKSLWSYDDRAGQYYQHCFYKTEPDLNVANPAVRDEIAKVMGFWLQLGLDGFRVDAVPFLLETHDNPEGSRLPDPHDYLADLRAFLSRRRAGAVLLGEVNLTYADTMKFFGHSDGVGDQLTMCFDFIGMQRMYLALARKQAGPLAEALRQRPDPPRDCHWATFVRNHDELTLDKLTDSERGEVFEAFGPDKDMQLYGRGLRRRVPSMLVDERRIRMVYSLLFSLPGTPVLFYGEEIGMVEDLRAEGRLAVRCPMAWTEDDPQPVSVAAQWRDPDSLLSWIKLLIERYRHTPELAWGKYTVLDAGAPAVLAHRSEVEDTVVVVHNLADTEASVRLTLSDLDDSKVLRNLLGDGRVAVSAKGEAEFSLEPYGCRWFRVQHG